MATGAYDANGIWQYGEDDNIALFSDLLKLGTESTSSAFTADRARLATLEAGSLSGLIPVNPTVATFAGGTGAVNAIGTITFSTCTSVSVDGVFGSNYKNYFAAVNTYSSITPGDVNVRLRTGAPASDISSGYRYAHNYILTSGSSGVSTSNSSTNISGLIGGIAASPTSMELAFFAPYEATGTNVHVRGWGSNNTIWQTVQGVGALTATTSCTGFTLYATAGNMTGQIEVFGFND